MSDDLVLGSDANGEAVDGAVATELAQAMALALQHVMQDDDGILPPRIEKMIEDKALMKRIARRTVAKLHKFSDTVSVEVR